MPLAMIKFLNSGGGEVDPGYGVPAPPGAVNLPVFPFDPTIDNSLPDSGGRPDRPNQGLPGSGGRPDQSLPGSQPKPDNTLPGGSNRPSQPIYTPVAPGAKFVVKWLACTGLILVPDNSLPSGPPQRPDQELPPTPEPKK